MNRKEEMARLEKTLMEFVEKTVSKAAKNEATAGEVEALPAVARLLMEVIQIEEQGKMRAVRRLKDGEPDGEPFFVFK